MTNSVENGSDSLPRDGTTRRECLRCEREFESKNKYNRLCPRCSTEISEMPEECEVLK